MKLVFYTPAPRPTEEEARQSAVDRSGFATSVGDPALQDIVRQAAALFDAPIAAISIVDHDRQWFPVRMGINATETPRAVSFCAHALHTPDQCLIVGDARADPRFAGNPLVLGGPRIRFYVGAPLLAGDGTPLGALCVLDQRPHETPEPLLLTTLTALARRAVATAKDRS